MRKIFICIVILTSSVHSLMAQEEVQLQLLDTIYFDVCDGESFTYIDYYKKTRFEKDTTNFDTLMGWDYYNRFFDTGDFDVKRMPCSISGKYGIIKHIMTVNTSDTTSQTVIIAEIESAVSAAYIIEDAFMSEEILYVPKQ